MSFLLSRLISSVAPSSTSATSSALSASKPSSVSSPSSARPCPPPYEVRVLIRGDKETGKSALLKRLLGGGFIEQHVVTPHITAATITWRSYKSSEDVVHVEVWDVVDKAAVKKTTTPSASASNTPSQSTPTTTTSSLSSSSTSTPAVSPPDTPSGTAKAVSSRASGAGTLPPASNLASSTSASTLASTAASLPLDAASCLSLYADCHAVMFLIDPTREWTLSYVKQQLPLVPRNLHVLLLLNFRDLPDSQRRVTDADMQQLMRSQPPNVKYLECSMKNGFGLKPLQSFFHLPFLHVKVERLMEEVRAVEHEAELATSELELISEQDYASYLRWLSLQVAEREKGMTDEERKVEAEKRVQQERLLSLLAQQQSKEDLQRADIQHKEQEKQAQQLARLQEERTAKAAKAAKKSAAVSTPLSPPPAAPSFVIDKAVERLDLGALDDFEAPSELAMDSFFGEPSQQPTVQMTEELRARQERTKPLLEDEGEGVAEEEELDMEEGKGVEARREFGPGMDDEGEVKVDAEDDELDEPVWELEGAATAHTSPFGAGHGRTAAAKEKARAAERLQRKANEKERQREAAREERQREAEVAKQRERLAQAQLLLQQQQAATEALQRVSAARSEASPPVPPAQSAGHVEEEDEEEDPSTTFRRPAKEYSFDDDEVEAAGPVFDDDEDEAPVPERKEPRGLPAAREEEVVRDEEVGELEQRNETEEKVAAAEASLREVDDRRQRGEKQAVQTGPASAVLESERQHLAVLLPVRLSHEEAKEEATVVKRPQRGLTDLIVIPTHTAPVLPDADLDIFGLAGVRGQDDGGKDQRRVEKHSGREKQASSSKGGEKERETESKTEKDEQPAALDSFLNGFIGAGGGSAAGSSAASSARGERERAKKASRGKGRRSVEPSDSDSEEDDDVRDLGRSVKGSRADQSKAKRRGHGEEERLEDDLELDVQLDVAAELEKAKKERAQKEKETREKERKQSRGKERDGEQTKKARRKQHEDDRDEEERRRKKSGEKGKKEKDGERRRDRGDRGGEREREGRKKREKPARKAAEPSSKAQRSSRAVVASDSDDSSFSSSFSSTASEQQRKQAPLSSNSDSASDSEAEREKDRQQRKRKEKEKKERGAKGGERGERPKSDQKRVDDFYDEPHEEYARRKSTKASAARAPVSVSVEGMGSSSMMSASGSDGGSGSAGKQSGGGFFSSLLLRHK